MSWSFSRTGRAETVRKEAAKQLEQAAKACERIPAEVESILAFAATLDAVCANAHGQAVRAEAGGSAWLDGRLRSFQFTAKIDVIDLTD